MIQARYLARTIADLSVGSERTMKEPTPEADLAWYAAYVADRRARGVDPQGVVMEGVVPDRLLDDPNDPNPAPAGPKKCKRGHDLTDETTYKQYDSKTGREYHSCLTCRHIRTKAEAARLKAKGQTRSERKKCRNGHPLTPENIMPNGYSASGKKHRKCRTCFETRNERLRGGARTGVGKKTHCPAGHEYTPDNTRWATNGYRVCRECSRLRSKNFYQRHLADKAEGQK